MKPYRKIELKMPFLSPEEPLIEVVRWLLPEGAAVDIDQDLLELTVDGEPFLLPSPIDGILLEQAVAPGDPVGAGQILGVIVLES